MCIFSRERAQPDGVICLANQKIGSSARGHVTRIGGKDPEKAIGKALIEELTKLFDDDPLLRELQEISKKIPTVAIPVSPTWRSETATFHTLVLANGKLKLLNEERNYGGLPISDVNRLRKIDLAIAGLEGISSQVISTYCASKMKYWRGDGQLPRVRDSCPEFYP